MTILLGWNPFGHGLDDTQRLFLQVLVATIDYFEISERAILFDVERDFDSALNTFVSGRCRVLQIVHDKFHQGWFATRVFGLDIEFLEIILGDTEFTESSFLLFLSSFAMTGMDKVKRRKRRELKIRIMRFLGCEVMRC